MGGLVQDHTFSLFLCTLSMLESYILANWCENIGLVKDDSEALNGEKTNLLQNSLSFLFFLQIDFLLNLPTLHPAQWFISILFWKANSDFYRTNIFNKKMSFGKFVLMMVGEQQTDKVATSSTLKVCCKRKGGRGRARWFSKILENH